MAMCFDSAPLEKPFEILGYPSFTVEFSSDKPQAMLFVSLCDVAPDGSSRRISYGNMNLTHLEGHDKVVLLKPGKKENVTIRLDFCGHRFAAGHKIRISLATSYWPMFWPMPEDATLTLDLTKAKFTLPQFDGDDCTGPEAQPMSASATPVTWLSTGKVDRTVSYDLVGDTWTCITDGVGGVFGEGIYRFDEIGVSVEHNLKRELVLSNTDPLSAKYNLTQQMRLGREDWMMDTEINISKTSDLGSFCISGEMIVKEKVKETETIVFEKTWLQHIKRKGI